MFHSGPPALPPAAVDLYRAMLGDRSLGPEELAESLGLPLAQVEEAMDVLADLALLEHVQPADRALPAHPRVGFAHVVARAEDDLARHAGEVAALRSLAEVLAAEHDAHQARETLVHHPTVAGVRARLAELSASARSECLSLNPGRAHRTDGMAASRPLNQQALERGVGIRAVYQDSFRHDADTLAYAQWLTGIGGQTRTMPVVPLLLVIVDAEVALVPRVVDDPLQGAIEVTSPPLVAALVHYFETVWSIADPFGESAPRRREVHSPTGRRLLQLLAAGATDEAAARSLGLSTRTVRRMMSEFLASVGARSRFQAGAEAHRRGLVE